ncbi:hypothetical protein ACTXT7_005587 [Hymenolepis weldensis]
MTICNNVGKIYRGHINRIDGMSQVTHVARSVRRWQASHPNLLKRKKGIVFVAKVESDKEL